MPKSHDLCIAAKKHKKHEELANVFVLSCAFLWLNRLLWCGGQVEDVVVHRNVVLDLREAARCSAVRRSV